MIFLKMIVSFWNVLNINESNSIQNNDKAHLTDQAKFRLNEISKIENYFNQETKERKLIVKN